MGFLLIDLPILLILAGAGIAAGLLAGLFGVGGGLIVVPVVFFVLQGQGVDAAIAMPVAVSTSLASIVPTALSSVRAHHKLGNVDWSLVWRIAPALVLGVVVGSQLIAQIRTTGFVVFFGLFLLFIALHTLWPGKRQTHLPHLPPLRWQWLSAGIVGAVSAVAGVGGGALGVPLLSAANVPVHRAIGSCAAFGLLIAGVGVISVISTANTPESAPAGTWRLVYLPALAALVPLTMLAAPHGAALGKKLPANLLRRLFALLLVLVSVRLLYAAWP